MQINRHNYETFFLLYADEELNANERQAVEDFVNENEDLKPELQMLIAAILPAEEIIFADKSFLYKNIVFDAALQEKLLLKIDDELSATELKNVNNILDTNKEALQEYNILLGTKLDAKDNIIFKEKQLLYKKERDNVIAFRWVRWAAAAVVIGIGLFLGISLFSKKNEVNGPVAINKKEQNNNIQIIAPVAEDVQNNAIAKTTETTVNTNNVSIINSELKSSELVKKEKPTTASIEKNIGKNIGNNIENTIGNNAEVLATNKTTEKTLPLQKAFNKEETVQVIASIQNTIKTKPVLLDDNIVPLETTYAKAASFTDEEKTDNKIFYMDEDEVKRSKVGGFFKKVKRLVERTAKIKTGNSISIAGFEIASK